MLKEWHEYSIGLMHSSLDEAAVMQDKFIHLAGLNSTRIDESILFLEFPPAGFDSFIVLSKHTSRAEQPSLTVHSTGNFGPESIMGGKAQSLGISFAPIQTLLLSNLAKYQNLNEDIKGFDIVIEATHHGPTLDVPLVFIEMGSTPDIWKSEAPALAIAWAIKATLSTDLLKFPKLSTAIGIGGPHYPKKFSEAMIDLKYFVGHVLPKHAAPWVSRSLILSMIERTVPRPSIALVDRKGMPRKSEIRTWLDEFGIEIVWA